MINGISSSDPYNNQSDPKNIKDRFSFIRTISETVRPIFSFLSDVFEKIKDLTVSAFHLVTCKRFKAQPAIPSFSLNPIQELPQGEQSSVHLTKPSINQSHLSLKQSLKSPFSDCLWLCFQPASDHWVFPAWEKGKTGTEIATKYLHRIERFEAELKKIESQFPEEVRGLYEAFNGGVESQARGLKQHYLELQPFKGNYSKDLHALRHNGTLWEKVMNAKELLRSAMLKAEDKGPVLQHCYNEFYQAMIEGDPKKKHRMMEIEEEVREYLAIRSCFSFRGSNFGAVDAITMNLHELHPDIFKHPYTTLSNIVKNAEGLFEGTGCKDGKKYIVIGGYYMPSSNHFANYFLDFKTNSYKTFNTLSSQKEHHPTFGQKEELIAIPVEVLKKNQAAFKSIQVQKWVVPTWKNNNCFAVSAFLNLAVERFYQEFINQLPLS